MISDKTMDIATPIIAPCCGDTSTDTNADTDASRPTFPWIRQHDNYNLCLVCNGILKPNNLNNFTLGVRQIWVPGSCRKMGIAGKLLDCARKSFILGNVYERGQVAFSQPTADGLGFAKRYTKSDFNHCILVYP